MFGQLGPRPSRGVTCGFKVKSLVSISDEVRGSAPALRAKQVHLSKRIGWSLGLPKELGSLSTTSRHDALEQHGALLREAEVSDFLQL